MRVLEQSGISYVKSENIKRSEATAQVAETSCLIIRAVISCNGELLSQCVSLTQLGSDNGKSPVTRPDAQHV